jgi:pyruvate dehydrogenase E1 component alpha subunit
VGDPAPYRSEDEVKAWKEKDPIKLYEEKLLSEGVLDKGSLTRIEEEIKVEVESSVDFARKSPMPDPAKATEYIYA